MLEMAVLGLLKEQDMHGYELKKRLSDVFGLSSAVSFGSLYPALARLEAAGAVRAVEAGPGESRRRKVYGITEAGSSMFSELLATSQGAGDDDRAFNLRLAFARYLPPEARLGMLERRRAVLGERLAQASAKARARREDRYMRVLADRQHEDLVRDVSWLERLIREERSAAEPMVDEAPVPTLAGPVSPETPATEAAAADAPVVGPVPGRPAPVPEPSPPRHWPRLVPLASASQLQRAYVPAVPSGGATDKPSPSREQTSEPVRP